MNKRVIFANCMNMFCAIIFVKNETLPDAGKSGWIDDLPKHFNTPIHWTEKEISKLQYPALVVNVAKQKTEWLAFYRTWQRSSPKDGGNNTCYRYEDLEWAMECAHSRAFSGPYEGSTTQQRIALLLFTALLAVCWPLFQLGSMEQSASLATFATLSLFLRDYLTFKSGAFKRYVLCPGIDMFNHNSSCVSDVSYNYFSDSFELRVLSARNAFPVAEVDSDKQSKGKDQPPAYYQPGEQVFINYGTQSNDRFLQYYGFVEQDNPHDVYDFGVSPVELILKYADRMHYGEPVKELPSTDSGMKLSMPTDPSPECRLQAIASMLGAGARGDTSASEKVCHPGSSGTVRYHARALPTTRDKSPRFAPSEGNAILARFDVLTVAALRALYCTPQEWSALFAPTEPASGTNALVESLLLCQQPLSAATEETVARALRSIICLELRDKPTTLQEDIAALEVPTISYSARTPLYLQFRIEKKKLLYGALQL